MCEQCVNVKTQALVSGIRRMRIKRSNSICKMIEPLLAPWCSDFCILGGKLVLVVSEKKFACPDELLSVLTGHRTPSLGAGAGAI